MNCDVFREHWHRRFDGEAHDSAVDRHQAECSACRSYAEQMEHLLGVLGGLRRESESIGPDGAVTSSTVMSKHRRYGVARGWVGVFRIAAALAFAAGAVAYLTIPRASREPAGRPPQEGTLTPGTDSGTTDRAGFGITLKGESADQYLAVGRQAKNPHVQVYWLYPTLGPPASGEDS